MSAHTLRGVSANVEPLVLSDLVSMSGHTLRGVSLNAEPLVLSDLVSMSGHTLRGVSANVEPLVLLLTSGSSPPELKQDAWWRDA